MRCGWTGSDEGGCLYLGDDFVYAITQGDGAEVVEGDRVAGFGDESDEGGVEGLIHLCIDLIVLYNF